MRLPSILPTGQAKHEQFGEKRMEGLSERDRETFLNLPDVIYRRSKAESRAGFPHLKDVLEGKTDEANA